MRQSRHGKSSRETPGGSVFARAFWPQLSLFATGAPAQTPEKPDQSLQDAERQAQPPADPAADLTLKRDSTRSELEALSKTITLSNDRAAELQAGIAEIEKTNEALRSALVDSAQSAKRWNSRLSMARTS